jgi:hypothetical protein
MKMRFMTLAAATIAVGIMASCSSDGKKDQTSKKTIEELSVEDVIFDDEAQTINYKIPSPLEMFVRMKNRNVPFNSELPNKTTNGVRYVTQYQQAVNMGVYASDMAYCCILGNSQNTLAYFNLVKSLSIEIGLYEGIDKDLADRVLNNLSETDTLLSVTSDSYHDVVAYIEEQGLVDIQCLVVAGAWVESLYLCLEPMKNQELTDETNELIRDHQVLLENLIELLDQNKQSGNVAKLLDELKLIQSVYDVTYQNKDEKVSKQQFINIVNTVADVRARLIM